MVMLGRGEIADLQVGMTSSSTWRTHSDHSVWTAVMGCTACARRITSAGASERPTYFTFPSSTSFFISPICQFPSSIASQQWNVHLGQKHSRLLPSPRSELSGPRDAGSTDRCNPPRVSSSSPRSRPAREPDRLAHSASHPRRSRTRTWSQSAPYAEYP
jgi:hypothetical protein